MKKLKPKGYIQIVLTEFCQKREYTLVKEYKFLDDHKFRFDWFIKELNIGIEYEGIISTRSRHTTLTGYSKDTEKYNLAQINEYKVLRFTALNYKDLDKYLTEIAPRGFTYKHLSKNRRVLQKLNK